MVTFSQPPQFKLDPRLARLLGLHTQSRSAIVQALWQYKKQSPIISQILWVRNLGIVGFSGSSSLTRL